MSDSETSDNERNDFKKQLSELSFEQLIQLKQKIGLKVFNETVKGESKKQNVDFKRTHKKRPREMSSKIPVDTFRKVVPLTNLKPNTPRDPRFESSCGEFNEAIFKKSYGFVKDMKTNDKNKLLTQLREAKNPEKKEQIKFLLQRMNNKEREETRKAGYKDAEKEERLSRKQAVKDGKKAHFYKKSEKKMISLVDNFESLKKSGKLMKHIERKLKSSKSKDRKKHSLRKHV